MATNFYKQNGSYYTTTGQKILDPNQLQQYAKAGGKELQAIPNPQSIANYDVMAKSGGTLYGLPKVPSSMSANNLNSGTNIPASTPDYSGSPESVMAYGQSTLGDYIKQADTEQARQDTLIKEQTEGRNAFVKLYETLGGKGQEYQTMLQQAGVNEDVSRLKELNTQIAALNASYTKSILGTENQGRGITTGIIGGQQNFLARQQAAEVGALTSMAQAIQGNITLATNTAKDAINMKYEAIEQQINLASQQLEWISSDLNASEQKQANYLTQILSERKDLIAKQKETENEISKIVLAAAQGGADVSTLQRIRNSKSYDEAIIAAGSFIKNKTTSGDGDPFKNVYLPNGRKYSDYQTDLAKSIYNVSQDHNKWGEEWNYLSTTYGVPNDVLDADLGKDKFYPVAEIKTIDKAKGVVKNWWSDLFTGISLPR